MTIEITRFTKADGPLTKRISLSDTGALKSDGSACVMTAGIARRITFESMEDFAGIIQCLKKNQAIALGALKSDLPARVQVTTKSRLRMSDPNATSTIIARTNDHFEYCDGEHALVLIDIDTKDMPAEVRKRIDELGGYWEALISLIPAIAGTGYLIRPSTSSGLINLDTFVELPGSQGQHIYLIVRDGRDIKRFLETLHDRCWLHNLGWYSAGAAGQILERSLIDRTVHAPERLVFEADPIVVSPLSQLRSRRTPIVSSGEVLDSRSACSNLTAIENTRLGQLKAKYREKIVPRAEEIKARFIKRQTSRLMRRVLCEESLARRTIERQFDGVLLPGIALRFDDEDLNGTSVSDVLADPAKYVGETLADPLEGVAYGRCKAKIMQRANGTLWIHSFAHGQTTYSLMQDEGSVRSQIDAAETSTVLDLFLRLLPDTDITPNELQELRELVCKRTGINPRPLDLMIKDVRARRVADEAEARRAHRTATRTDNRPQIKVPRVDAERLPVLRTIDEALSASSHVERPMRDLEGRPIELRSRAPMMLHTLTAGGSNQEEIDAEQLPAPEMLLLSPHNRFSMAHEIEQHIEFTRGDDALPVALPREFVDHYMAYRDSSVPQVGAVVTTPLVMRDGELIAQNGINTDLKAMFKLEPKLFGFLSKLKRPGQRNAALALRYLTDEWLIDVATDFKGKCVLVALAETILERVLLPERPGFFITAGKRGGGKTTASSMVIAAVTGRRPAAAAWSGDEEERRKAMLSSLIEGVPALVWDNIRAGMTISCPTLEKVLTSAAYSDRLLGSTAIVTVPAFTVMILTGNNISPRGDLSSRTLTVRLDIDRPDPENRKFAHSDPVAWTFQNRAKILEALYTILLANPQLRAPQSPKTRFKTWWHLVGSAVEHAAAGLQVSEQDQPAEDRPAREIDFGQLFAENEVDDEEVNDTVNVLEALYQNWGTEPFRAADVATTIGGMSCDENIQENLLAFFDPVGARAHRPITAITIGKRLKSIVGCPVTVGYRQMMLAVDHGPETAKRTARYRVKVTEDDL